LIFHGCGLHNRFPTTASVCGEWTGNRVDDRSSQHAHPNKLAKSQKCQGIWNSPCTGDKEVSFSAVNSCNMLPGIGHENGNPRLEELRRPQ
jgi:hypothetical protein